MSQIHNSSQAFDLLSTQFNPLVEEFWLIILNSQLEVKEIKLISRGTLNLCLVHPRDVFRTAITENAYSIILAHNHPSLNPEPSPEDLKLTKKLMKGSRLLDIPIVDHIIFTDLNYFSFKQNKLI